MKTITFSTHLIGSNRKLLKIIEHGSKIARSSVSDCHLLPVRLQMAIETLFLPIFYLRSLTFLIVAYLA